MTRGGERKTKMRMEGEGGYTSVVYEGVGGVIWCVCMVGMVWYGGG